MKRKTVLIGWDSADWNIINPLLQQGKLPALKSLMNRGISGKIKTLDPPLSPMLWTSIATGVRADKHGILGFVEPSPNGESIRPVSSTSRKVKAIWNILNQNGFKSNIVGWWPSYPVEPINGIMVSDRFLSPENVNPTKELSLDGMVHPKEMTEIFDEFRVSTYDITGDMLAPFVPNIATDEPLREHNVVEQTRKNIAHASNVHAAFTYALQETEWDFAAVYYEAMDMLCHIGMKFAPPYRPEIQEKNYNDFKEIVESAYRLHDLMLDRLLDIIDKDTNIILVSDHGFHSGLNRPLYIPNEPAGIAAEHSPFGILVMAGPDVNVEGKITGASVLDITPTLLHLLGLPVGKDMEGKVLESTIANVKPIKWVESWEKMNGDSGQHDESLREDPIVAQEAIQQLVELGYIDAPDENTKNQVQETIWENLYYKARNMVDGGRVLEGIEVFEKIFDESNHLRYGYRLAQNLLLEKRFFKVKPLIEKLRTLKVEQDKITRESIIAHHKKTGIQLKYKSPNYVDVLEGLYHFATGNLKEAAKHLKKAQKDNPNNLEIAYKIGILSLEKRQYKVAKSQFIRMLSVDDRIALAHHGLGMALEKLKDYSEAINEYLIAIENDFNQPRYHFSLGELLEKCGYYEEALSAFKVCVHLKPRFLSAHIRLANLYENHLKNEKEANFHRTFIQDNQMGKKVIVTGLSGAPFEKLFKQLNENELACIFNKHFVEETGLYKIDLDLEANNPIYYVPANLLNQLPKVYEYKVFILEEKREILIENLISSSNAKNLHLLTDVEGPLKEDELSIEAFLKNSKIEKIVTFSLEHINVDELIFLISEK
jgi:predicted AlkP superfamily phosphohydrolase/phosphomutase/tetratricopeptide (TPR) repeat protein